MSAFVLFSFAFYAGLPWLAISLPALVVEQTVTNERSSLLSVCGQAIPQANRPIPRTGSVDLCDQHLADSFSGRTIA